MNIKEKLIELGIDVDKDKKAVNLAKEKLKEIGMKADRIVAKLDANGEKVLEDLFSKSASAAPIAVAVPKTIKKDEDIPVNPSSKKSLKNKFDIFDDFDFIDLSNEVERKTDDVEIVDIDF